MLWLVQDFAFLSVALRAVLITLQTLTAGGIVFTSVVLPRPSGSNTFARNLRWIARFAFALAAVAALYIAVDSALLSFTLGVPPWGLMRTTYFLCGGFTLVLGALIGAIARRASGLAVARSPAILLPAATLLMVNSVLTSHAFSRLDHRVLLSALTFFHQSAAAVWLGGVVFVFITLRSSGIATGVSQATVQRFSRLALISVFLIAGSGIWLSVYYIGSAQALYGTAYGVMVLYKATMLAVLLWLGSVAFSTGRGVKFARSTVALLRRVSEVEIAIGFAVLLTAASLTSQPPGVDLIADRLTPQELAQHFQPRWPVLHHPPLESLAPATAIDEMLHHPDDVERAADHTNRDPDLAWSEFEHNWSGIMLIFIGLGGYLSTRPAGRWARYWPLLFFPMAIFLMVFSDPENWPLGPVSYWRSFSDPEVLLHRIFFSLLIVYGIFETGVQTGRLKKRWAGRVFPAMVAFGASGLLLHSHALGNVKLELLAEYSHTAIGILGVMTGAFRWAELDLRHDLRSHPGDLRLQRAASVTARIWPLCLVAIGLVLFNYREG